MVKDGTSGNVRRAGTQKMITRLPTGQKAIYENDQDSGDKYLQDYWRGAKSVAKTRQKRNDLLLHVCNYTKKGKIETTIASVRTL